MVYMMTIRPKIIETVSALDTAARRACSRDIRNEPDLISLAKWESKTPAV